MLSQRRMRRMLLVPCVLCLILYTAQSFFNAVTLVRPRQTNILTTATVTILEQETATPHVDFQQEFEEPLQPHVFRSDGLLEVNPNGRHPMYDLIERAEAKWAEKLKRQSKSLDEAVSEYERRYHRAPPKGFDDWWFYCEYHNVQLPDEYDQLHNNLEPFWGVDPVDLHRLQAEHESLKDSYTIGKTEDSETITLLAVGHRGAGPNSLPKNYLVQARETMDLLQDVAKFIPPFRAVFSPHDNPNLFTDWDLKTQALQAAAAGKYIDIKQPPPLKHLGWPSACAPESPLRHTSVNSNDPPSPPTKKTFIYDHLRAMDPCNHPSLLLQHGQFLSQSQGPMPKQVMIPQFSYCSTSMHHDILTAIRLDWVDDILSDANPDFQDRLDERLSWRGTTTGIWHAEHTLWRSQHRIRLVQWANEHNGTVSVLRSTKSRHKRVGEGNPVSKARLNPAMLDVAFTGEPRSCSKAVCKVIEAELQFRDWQNSTTAGTYKYVLDVDGNGWSSRFKRLMVSNSLVFKSTIYPGWYQDRIQEYLHYIPVQLDLSDLYDSLTFFRGDLYGEGAHEELAAKIAHAGRKWSKEFWRQEDMTAYMFRLFLEYARVMSLDREAMSYKERDSSF